MLRTHCRTGTSGNTWSIRCAARSAIRRPANRSAAPHRPGATPPGRRTSRSVRGLSDRARFARVAGVRRLSRARPRERGRRANRAIAWIWPESMPCMHSDRNSCALPGRVDRRGCQADACSDAEPRSDGLRLRRAARTGGRAHIAGACTSATVTRRRTSLSQLAGSRVARDDAMPL